MKQNNFLFAKLAIFKVVSLMAVLLIIPLMVIAQDDETKPAKKQKARLSLSYININNMGPRLKATVKTKVDRSYERVQGVRVNFYLGEISEENRLGYTMSNEKGEATLILPETLRKEIAKVNDFLFYATIEEDDKFKDKEKELEIRTSHTKLTFEEKDSLKQISLFIGSPDSAGLMVPVAETAARIFVQRLFGLLPVSEEFEKTDENGILRIDFPNDIPGDENGNVEILAKLDDHDEYGTLIATRKINWGVPLKIDNKAQRRELWSARANSPLWLVILSNAIILVIWGTLAYIILQVVKIFKLGRNV